MARAAASELGLEVRFVERETLEGRKRSEGGFEEQLCLQSQESWLG